MHRLPTSARPGRLIWAAAALLVACGGAADTTTSTVPPTTQGGVTTTSAPATTSMPETTTTTSPPTTLPGDFECTEVIGFSQTRQWWEAGFLGVIDLSENWQLRAKGGAEVDRWADPDFPGWTDPIDRRCGEPDRVVFNVTGSGRPVEHWVPVIESVIEVVRDRYQPRLIVLQAVVGGPDGEHCPAATGRDVRDSTTHMRIAKAIELVVGGDVAEGIHPQLTDCDQYSDDLGHLTAEGAEVIAEQVAAYYNEIDG